MALLSRAFVRRRIISLATRLAISAMSFALAPAPAHPHRPIDRGPAAMIASIDMARAAIPHGGSPSGRFR